VRHQGLIGVPLEGIGATLGLRVGQLRVSHLSPVFPLSTGSVAGPTVASARANLGCCSSRKQVDHGSCHRERGHLEESRAGGLVDVRRRRRAS
jgi:hypothetical protein